MTHQRIIVDSLGTALVPEYVWLYDLVASEVGRLSDEQLDFRSERWEWCKWSIRMQLSHMASLLFRWMLLRWGGTLFPDGDHGVRDLSGHIDSGFDRRLDDKVYWDLTVIMGELRLGIDLVQRVLAEYTVGSLRSLTHSMDLSTFQPLMIKAHSNGFAFAEDSTQGTITLEATMRHMYFEETTHLYNIQRIKRAQGLPILAEIPRVGYWVVDGWDRSEAV